MLEGIRISCWETKKINIDGTNLTNINFAYIGSQVKTIDTIKYIQVSLMQIASTMTEVKKRMFKN